MKSNKFKFVSITLFVSVFITVSGMGYYLYNQKSEKFDKKVVEQKNLTELIQKISSYEKKEISYTTIQQNLVVLTNKYPLNKTLILQKQKVIQIKTKQEVSELLLDAKQQIIFKNYKQAKLQLNRILSLEQLSSEYASLVQSKLAYIEKKMQEIRDLGLFSVKVIAPTDITNAPLHPKIITFEINTEKKLHTLCLYSPPKGKTIKIHPYESSGVKKVKQGVFLLPIREETEGIAILKCFASKINLDKKKAPFFKKKGREPAELKDEADMNNFSESSVLEKALEITFKK